MSVPVSLIERGRGLVKTRYFPITCVYSSSRRDSIVPLICISGGWLEHAGFMTGDEISVRVRKPGELIVTILPELEDEL